MGVVGASRTIPIPPGEIQPCDGTCGSLAAHWVELLSRPGVGEEAPGILGARIPSRISTDAELLTDELPDLSFLN